MFFKFIGHFPDYLLALSTFVETAVCVMEINDGIF